MCKLELCPKCIGSKEVMESKSSGKGFEYKTCTLCKGKGYVDNVLADDFIFSISEDNFETDND